MMNFLKKVDAIDSNKKYLEKRTEDVDKKVPDTNRFILSQDFIRLTKKNLV